MMDASSLKVTARRVLPPGSVTIHWFNNNNNTTFVDCFCFHYAYCNADHASNKEIHIWILLFCVIFLEGVIHILHCTFLIVII